MKWLYSKIPYFILVFVGFLIILLFIFDFVLSKRWLPLIILLSIFIVILFFVLYLLKSTKDLKLYMSVEAFEKTLKGGLYHFKCMQCLGIFAIKKTRKNDKKPVKMTCPVCGEIGIIPVHPFCIEEEIPEKKSINADFKCIKCGEGITVWAEGTSLYEHTSILSCPFCGVKKPLRRF